MAVTLGTGEFRYEVLEDWAKLPDGWTLRDAAAVAVDSKDRVYVFNRSEHPMMVFDREGNFLRSWGEGVFRNAHGIHIGSDQTLYCTDDGDHTVRKCTLEGKVLLEIGIPGKPSPYMSGEPFHRCTHTALSPRGDIYIADGYGNARVHKYSPDGKLLLSWGEAGTDPGQFNIPHNICCDPDGWVYVADRENHRVQVLDPVAQPAPSLRTLHGTPAPSAVLRRRDRSDHAGQPRGAEPWAAGQHPDARGQTARSSRRRSCRPACKSVHRTARHGGRFAR
jgi:NHL repeat-containing protein